MGYNVTIDFAEAEKCDLCYGEGRPCLQIWDNNGENGHILICLECLDEWRESERWRE